MQRLLNYMLLLLLCGFLVTCSSSKKIKTVLPPPPPPVSMDSDGDAVPDTDDRCPNLKGVARYQGCPIPDTDHDGVNDEEDKCPSVAGLIRYQGCPIPDTDHDGLNDEEDKCPFVKGDSENFGCPVLVEANVKPNEDSTQIIKPPLVIKSRPSNPAATVTDDTTTIAAPRVSLAYSYKDTMTVGKNEELAVIIQAYKTEEFVKKALQNYIGDTRILETKRTDTSIVKTLEFTGGKYLTVIAIPQDKSIFTVKLVDGFTERQLLNYEKGNKWKWELEAKKEAVTARINMFVYVQEDTTDEPKLIDSQGLRIEINVGPKPKNNYSYIWYIVAGVLLTLAAVFIWLKTKSRKQLNTRVYISYAWDDNHDGIIDRLYNSLDKDGFDVVRDKVDLPYRSFISEFMIAIGNANFIVVGVSDNYLRSKYCMFELSEVYRNAGMDSARFQKRIFPIWLQNINLGDPHVFNSYINFWEGEEKRWEEQMQENIDNVMSEQGREYQAIKRIVSELGNILLILANINASNREQLSQNDFLMLRKHIRESIKTLEKEQ